MDIDIPKDRITLNNAPLTEELIEKYGNEIAHRTSDILEGALPRERGKRGKKNRRGEWGSPHNDRKPGGKKYRPGRIDRIERSISKKSLEERGTNDF